MVYKWIDGTTLSWGAFNTTPWKDAATPVDDVTKTCVIMEWGAGLNWKHHSCNSTEDFLCEGFYLNPAAVGGWSAGKSACEGMGMKLASLKSATLNDAAIKYINIQQSSGRDKNVWVGIGRYTSQAGMVYKWIDGTTLSWGAFNTTPWKDAATPVDDVTKTCVIMEWGAGLNWKHHSCNSTEDFLCEGFYLNPAAVGGWSAGKSACEGMGMKLASLKSATLNDAAIKYINIQQSSGSVNDVWFGLKISGGQYYYEDGTALTSGVYGNTHFAYPWRSYEPNNPSTDFCIRLQSVGSGAFEWADYNCGTSYNYLCQAQFPLATTTTTTTTTTPPTTTTAILQTTTKPWWFVEYSDDGKAIGKNGKTFDQSQPPVKFGVIGLAIGFSTFAFLTIVICSLWFCCIRNKEDYRHTEEEEEEEEKPKVFTPISQKPHGIQYIA